jgi:hypothetical protein
MIEALLAILVVLGATIGISIYYAMVLVVLWGWFIVPFGLPPITISHAIGLATIVNLFRYQETQKSENWQQDLINVMIKPLAALAIGYVVKSLMVG